MTPATATITEPTTAPATDPTTDDERTIAPVVDLGRFRSAAHLTPEQVEALGRRARRPPAPDRGRPRPARP
jgi:hypothetical protein